MEYLQHQAVHTRDPQSSHYNVKVLRRFFGGKRLDEITPKSIEDMIAARLADGKSKPTINRQRACLHRMLNLAARWGYLSGPNPAGQVQKFPEHGQRLPYLTQDQINRLIECAAPHLKPFIFAAVLTGARRSELLRLRKSDIDIERGLMTIRAANSKSGKARIIPLHPSLACILKTLTRQSPGNLLFTWNGAPIKSVKTGFNRAAREAGLKGLHLHDLRHVFATRFVEDGGDQKQLQKILGHASLSQSDKYVNVSQRYIAGAVEFIKAPDSFKGKTPAH